jgi:hypothetical protein
MVYFIFSIRLGSAIGPFLGVSGIFNRFSHFLPHLYILAMSISRLCFLFYIGCLIMPLGEMPRSIVSYGKDGCIWVLVRGGKDGNKGVCPEAVR